MDITLAVSSKSFSHYCNVYIKDEIIYCEQTNEVKYENSLPSKYAQLKMNLKVSEENIRTWHREKIYKFDLNIENLNIAKIKFYEFTKKHSMIVEKNLLEDFDISYLLRIKTFKDLIK
jgi:hypothetical protein